MRPPFISPPLARLRVRPDQPGVVTAPRRRGSRRPHGDATVAAVRRLVEETALTYGEIAAKTGVARASICRWTRDGGWTRHPFAPRATDTVPRPRASAQLRLRTLSARLAALAERHIRELEEAACVDPDRLAEALELMKMAKLAARPRRRRRSATEVAADKAARARQAAAHAAEHHARRTMRALRAAGVDTYCVSDAPLEDFVDSHAPPPARHRPARGRRFTGDDYHAWLLKKE
jgi:hypothetical protein